MVDVVGCKLEESLFRSRFRSVVVLTGFVSAVAPEFESESRPLLLLSFSCSGRWFERRLSILLAKIDDRKGSAGRLILLSVALTYVYDMYVNSCVDQNYYTYLQTNVCIHVHSIYTHTYIYIIIYYILYTHHNTLTPSFPSWWKAM